LRDASLRAICDDGPERQERGPSGWRAPAVFRGRTFGQPNAGTDLRKWEPGLDRLDDLIPGETLRGPAPPISAGTVGGAFVIYTSSFGDRSDPKPTTLGPSWLAREGSRWRWK